MLASTKNDNEDCIRQGARPVYLPIFKVLLGFQEGGYTGCAPLADTIFIIIVRWQHCPSRFKFHTLIIRLLDC